MKFQCSFCYFINKIDNKYLGMQVRCGNCGKVMLIPKSAFGIGRVIADEFVIAKELGSGGLGVVYRAHQMSLDRDVALKLLYNKYAKDPEYAKDFKEEAKAAARISHPSIVKSLAFGRDHGILYFAMTLVEGETCSKLLKTEGNLKIDKALNIIQQVAEGLHEAWIEETLIHRDIKSSNIIVNTNGLAMVTDLGLARKAQKITKEKETSGTPAYMSPEQLLNDPLDSRSDIYSMGITLFELLTGELPFNGENLQEIARQHFSDDINFKNLDIAIPRNVQKLIKRMTAKELEDRFLNYEALLTDIVKVRKQLTLHKEAIPNVHTLSINRYKLFDRTPELKTLAQQKTEENIERQEKSAKQGILFIAGLILGMLLLGAVWFALTPSKNMQLIGELRSFLKKTESYEFNKVPLKLKKQGELLLKKYPIGESIYEVEVLNSLKKWLLDLKDAKNRKNLIEIDVKQREFIVIKEELEAKKNE
ncbi:MAG: serine/threonine-protein kinase, partial [Verrucomicrobiota bacterium]|nr:serine/threonine-protein kinase [Verrucomicrobiota bacterium]